MQKQYLMGQDDWLSRLPSSGNRKTYINPRLKQKLIELAIFEAFNFYAYFFDKNVGKQDYKQLAADYQSHLDWGYDLGLFGPGSIPEKDHLSLWCLAKFFAPKKYIESGVFIGSSLHAFLAESGLEKVIVIDPNLKALKIPEYNLPNADLIDNKDFSQLELKIDSSNTLAYFDDHIDTAARIEQAVSKGLEYILFDDSTGFEGIVQRFHPAIPTLPMIVNHEWFEPGDEIGWMYDKQSQLRNSSDQIKNLSRYIKSAAKGLIHGRRSRFDWVSLSITEQLLEECRRAKQQIECWCQIPNLGLYTPQGYPYKTTDTTKYLVRLRSRNS